MLPVDMPTREEILALAAERSDACVSIYVETTPLTQDVGGSVTALKNAFDAALGQLSAAGLDKRRVRPLEERMADLLEDEAFWARQARTLAVLATPDRLRTFRLASRVAPTTQVSDRFHLKPLLRALTQPHAGYVLALSENGARLVEVFPDAAPVEIRVPDMPRDAADAVGKASINDRSHSQRIVGSEGKKVRLRQYARAVDAALRPVLAADPEPLALASNPPLDALFREVCGHPGLLAEGVTGAVDRMTPLELSAAARPLFDAAFAARVAEARDLFARREAQGRATLDLSTAARAAAMGAIETLMVDMDAVVPGTVDEETGAVTFAAAEGPDSYGVADRVALMALATGARVLSVRREDLPQPAPVAATLRYAF
jgi:hypothetical protein